MVEFLSARAYPDAARVLVGPLGDNLERVVKKARRGVNPAVRKGLFVTGSARLRLHLNCIQINGPPSRDFDPERYRRFRAVELTREQNPLPVGADRKNAGLRLRRRGSNQCELLLLIAPRLNAERVKEPSRSVHRLL